MLIITSLFNLHSSNLKGSLIYDLFSMIDPCTHLFYADQHSL